MLILTALSLFLSSQSLERISGPLWRLVEGPGFGDLAPRYLHMETAGGPPTGHLLSRLIKEFQAS